MGRKWANIKDKKAAKEATSSKVFAKFGVEIYVAAKQGDPDPKTNRKLQSVMERAKTYNVPKHVIIAQLKKQKVQVMKHTLNYATKVLDQTALWLLLIR